MFTWIWVGALVVLIVSIVRRAGFARSIRDTWDKEDRAFIERLRRGGS